MARNYEIAHLRPDEVAEFLAEQAPTVFTVREYIDPEDCALRNWIADLVETYPNRYDRQELPSEVFGERQEYQSGWHKGDDLAREVMQEYRQQVAGLMAWSSDAICDIILRDKAIRAKLKRAWDDARHKHLLDDEQRRSVRIAARFGVETAADTLALDDEHRRILGLDRKATRRNTHKEGRT